VHVFERVDGASNVKLTPLRLRDGFSSLSFEVVMFKPLTVKVAGLVLLLAGATRGSASAQANWVVWSQPVNTNWAVVPSYVGTDPVYDVEIADDFELFGTVGRIVATGYDCFNCAAPEIAGVYVRLYDWTATGPGAMQDEIFLAANDPGFHVGVGGPGTLDLTLLSPVTVKGKLFVSVQLALAGSGSWYWWVTNVNSPMGSGAMTRDRAAGPNEAWEPIEDSLGSLSSDVGLMLWGVDANPPAPGTDPCGIWTVVAAPNPASSDHVILRDVATISSDDVWATGEYTIASQTFTLAEHWDGVSWTIVPSPSPSACAVCTWATFDAVAAAGPNDIWAAGGKRVQSTDGYVGTHVFVARYDGSAWTVMNTPLTVGGSGAHVNGIEIISPNDTWFFGEWIDTSGGPGGSQQALAMHWNGSTFTVTPTPYPGGGTPGWGLDTGSALTPNDMWAVGGGSDGDSVASSYIVHWNGSAWTRVLGPAPGAFQRLYDVEMIATDDVWAVGEYLDVAVGYLPLSLHWDGATWTQVTSPGGGSSLVAFASDNIYSGGAGIVHWDGQSRQHVESFPSVIGPPVSSLSASSLCDMWAVGRQIVAGDLLNFTAQLRTIEVGAFSIAGDLNNDGAVDAADLAILFGALGRCPAAGACPADLNANGVVNGADLAIVLGNWSV